MPQIPDRWTLLAIALAAGSLPMAVSPVQARTEEQPVTLPDPGFEDLGQGWTSVTIAKEARLAPPEGRGCALGIAGDENWTHTISDHVVRSGDLLRAKVWVKRVNPPGNPASAVAALRLVAAFPGGREVPLALTNRGVDPPRLSGAAANTPSDDGVNVWFDDGFRMHFGDVPMYQPSSSDPILDPWFPASTVGYEFDNALGPVRTTPGLRAVYDCFYDDGGPSYESFIGFRRAAGSPPDYDWDDDYEVVLEHTPEEFPWVIDPHLFEDPDTGRLWMCWGGHVIFVTEMDPATGRVLGNPPDPEIDTHPAGTHTPILKWPESRTFGGNPEQPADWCGDEDSRCYMEGPALFKRGDWWYAFASYGNLGADYTIRMARARDPRGPYRDKDGVAGTTFDQDLNRYGASMLIAPEGDHVVPGHPAVWSEEGRLLIGYDHRLRLDDPIDRMAIRELRIVDGWPTIWEPLEILMRVDASSAAIGGRLQIGFRNEGETGSVVAFDRVELAVTSQKRLADLDGDGCVGPADLGLLLSLWNAPAPPEGDLDGDGTVGAADLGILLASWDC